MNSRWMKFLLALLAFFTLICFYASDAQVLFLMTSILLVTGTYLVGTIRLWRNAGVGHGLPVWRAVGFFSAMAILVFTLTGFLDKMADKAFSMHMVQHMLLIKVIAPLILLGEFPSVFLWAIGKNEAHHFGESWKRSSRLRIFWKQITNPGVAWTLFALCLWVWHIPALYQAALQNELLHDLEHLLFLGTSLLFWWYPLQNGGDSRVRYGAAIIYLFTTLLHESAMGALLTFSSRNWYGSYASANPWGFSPLADQQLAGMIMWLPGGILFMVLIVWYFGSWLQAIEKGMLVPRTELPQTGDAND